MHAACLSGCGGARWGRGGVTAAKGRWSWAVRWVKVTVGQQVLLENKWGAELLSAAALPAPSGGSPRQ